MKELDKGLEISIKGANADRAVAVFQHQIELWGMVMPSMPLLVLDFGLDDFNNTGLIECWIANETEAGYCGKYLFVSDGQTCPSHSHREKHETFFVVKGRGLMKVDGVQQEVSEGSVVTMPPGQLHSFTGIGPMLLLELSSPCWVEDNFFENKAIQSSKNYKVESGELEHH